MQPWQTPEYQQLALSISQSFEQLLGQPLVALPATADMHALCDALYEAPFVVLAHDGADDPRFTYANRCAQTLWEMDWKTFIGMPSRYSAEPDLRERRAEMLARVQRDGYIDDYSGVRISRSGQRFELGKTIVWNLTDTAGDYCGQAATFRDWTQLQQQP